MPKQGFGGLFQNARRKSSGNAIEDIDPSSYQNTSPSTEQGGGFRVLTVQEKAARAEENARKAQQKQSKFGRFSSGFGTSSNKTRTQSTDEDSPSSSKRYVTNANPDAGLSTESYTSDSKSSSGTQSFTSRPYHAGHYGGSSSTLPSSAESDPNDNIFSNLPPRPNAAQHTSSPGSLSMGHMRKQLPAIPSAKTIDNNGRYYGQGHDEPSPNSFNSGRSRAMTTSSYASTAIPPKLDADLDFGSSGFDDLFSGLNRKASPDFTKPTPGRSLLSERRTFQAEPIHIDRKLEVEAPLQSWDSRGSGDHLIASPTDDTPSPPPVPLHKYSKYAPVASHSPELNGSRGFEDEDAKLVRQSAQLRKQSVRDSSPEQKNAYTSSSSAASLQTPLSSLSTSNTTTPKAALLTSMSPPPIEDDNLFASSPAMETPARKPVPTMPKEKISPPAAASGEPSRRVLTAAEFKAQQQLQMTQPQEDSSESEDDYEDEEEAIRKREEEQKAIRQRQQMSLARDHMRRSTTAPSALSNGFPSEVSLQADQWSDEDVPLGVLAQHGFPGRNKPPTQPSNAMPSYFRSSTPTLPDRPASAGPSHNQTSNGYRPAFARNLPDDPFAAMIGGGLVQQTNRESMGFSNRGAASVYNEPTGMGFDPQPQFTSLVDQIQMRDMAKQKYTGGASTKKPAAGPFTGALSSQMYAMNQNNNPTRMSQMQMNNMNGMSNGMPNGMPGTNPMMMNMMGGQMPMMGMNQMPYMYPQNDQMQQQMQQYMFMMQAQQQMNPMFGQQQQPIDPRMSMISPNSGFPQQQFQNNGYLQPGGVPGRPMSIMSINGSQPNRPYSAVTPGMPHLAANGFLAQPPMPGYTPSIAPSERSVVGLSARYRPVATGNGMNDSQSTTSGMTLQASGGANQPNKTVKGILKNKSSQVAVREDDEDDWGSLAARRNKFQKGGATSPNNLQELAQGVSY